MADWLVVIWNVILNVKEWLLPKYHLVNDPENGPVFTLRDVEARESYSFDSIDLIAMEIYDLLY